jgi:beta-lactamase class A
MRFKSYIYPLSLICIGFSIGVLLPHPHLDLLSSYLSYSKQVRSNEGRFTNPLLECEIAEGTIDAEKINFKKDLELFVKKIEATTSTNEIAVYFRDLNNGPTFGINQEDPFIPASLLKVPVMMTYYRAADSNPEILNKKIVFQGETASPAEQTILPTKRLTKGQSYSIDELIEHMIIYSDNDAVLLLFKEIPIKEFTYLYNLLGVNSKVISDFSASLSVKQYAAFFRILFNSSFLSQERSEKALSLLSQIDFKKGLREGTPQNVLLAHKFGERQINTGERHFHDCGIVYYPKHPYLLCVMTRGAETPTLERAISEISSFVYSKIDAQYK